MAEACCICAIRPGERAAKDYLTVYFTDRNRAKNPSSDRICTWCSDAIRLRAWYFNPTKQAWVKLFARNWSWLYQGEQLIAPTLGPERGEGKDQLPVVSDLPTRVQMRGWLLDPPEPPFTIAIAESGQKHILPWAMPAYSRDYYPVQFELDSLWVDRVQFAALLSHYEALLGWFSKTEIDSGAWHSDRLMKALGRYEAHDQAIAPHRGTRLLQLLSYVAQKEA